MTQKTYCTRISQDNESSLLRKAVEHQAVAHDMAQPPINFDPRLSGETRERSLLHLQQNVGNRTVQRMIDRSRASANPTDDLAQRIRAASLGGSALDSATRYRLQESLNADLSSVRIHTDEEADRLSRSVEAIAFTTGSDIFFRHGAYQPNTASGLHLLAHEAAHTIQQANGPVEGTPASVGDVSISDPADHFEQAAERAADQVITGSSATSHSPLAGSWAATSAQRVAVQREGEEGGSQEETPWWQNMLEGAAGIAPMIIPGAGLVTEPLLASIGVHEGITKGSPLGWAHAVTGETGLAAELGGFELLGAEGAGGLSVLGTGEGTLAGAAAAGDLGMFGLAGPAAAVAGAGLAGVGIGMGLDKGVSALGQYLTGNKQRDYSISRGLAEGMATVDETNTEIMRQLGLYDESKPAYTQTLGWKLASLFD